MFRYLLVNHVPFGAADQPGRYRLGSLWLADLHAQAAALADVGGKLTVATPLVPQLTAKGSGSFELAEIAAGDAPFTYAPLPHYITLPAYLRARRSLVHALHPLLADADIVQFGPGGHPLPLSYNTWGLAGTMRCKRIWTMDGGDFTAQRRIRAHAEPHWLKRKYKVALDRRLFAFEQRCVREADLVFAHNRSSAQTFAAVWGPQCHIFDRSFVTDDMLSAAAEIAARGQRVQDATRPLRLVVASRLIAIKAVDEVLHAVAQARAKQVAIELDVFGDGDQRAALEESAGALGIARVTRFHGAVPYGPAFLKELQTSDVMVVTNVVPEFSRNILLAMALGLPLIAYANPGHDELLAESDAARVVPARDTAGLAAALVAAAQDRAGLARQIAAGAEYARERTLEACHRRRAVLAAAVAGRHLLTPQAE